MWTSAELRELRVFLVLADELHFGRTADRMGLTTSRVSQLLRVLERRVGGRLVERTSRRVALTPLGVTLRASLAPAVDAVDAALTAARDSATGVAGPLRLGVYSTLAGGPSFLAILDAFHRRHPEAAVEVVETPGADPVAGLRRGEVDLVVTRLPVGGGDVEIGPVLSEEDRVVLVGRRHRLAGRPSVCFDELGGETVAAAAGLDPTMVESFAPSRTPAGLPVHREVVHTPAGLLGRVALGRLVHLTVPSFLAHYRHGEVVEIPVEDLPPSRTALVCLRGRGGVLARAFVAVAAEVLATA